MSSVFVFLLLDQPEQFAGIAPPQSGFCQEAQLVHIPDYCHCYYSYHFSKHQFVHIPSQLPPGHLVLKQWTIIRCVVQVQIERLFVDCFFFSVNSLFQRSFWKVFLGGRQMLSKNIIAT